MQKYLFIILLALGQISLAFAQESVTYTNDLEAYYHAVELYYNKNYVAAQIDFDRVKNQFDTASEQRANCDYYIANCAVRLGQLNADELMQEFVTKYPNSAKRNDAFMEVANYYYNTGKYTYALKWLKKVNYKNIPRRKHEDYLFKYGYALFSSKKYTASKKYFVQLLDSQKYGAKAKYYYGYIAYQQDDYDNADKYLTEVSEEKEFKKNVSYYMANMNFKLGKFQEALDKALPLLPRAKRKEKSEINKIIGESYFNLAQYDKAILHLKAYKGKRNKWTNTDYYLLGYAYYKKQDYENAISYFNKIIDGKNAVAQNAYYHLAECYLRQDKKLEALNAFRNASQVDFKPQIKEDAYLNYAKLSYEIGNPYKSVPEVLQDFLIAYPASPETKNIKNLVVSSYVVSKDYKGAFEYLKNNSIQDKSLYQKVAYLRGLQLFTQGEFQEAKTHFESSLSHAVVAKITAKTYYWKGESAYQLKDYNEALQAFKAFKSSEAASQCNDEHDRIDYQIAYVYFKQKEYTKAIKYFKNYLKATPKDPVKINDAHLRMGDVYFVTSAYKKAINSYKKSQKINTKTADYAIFQSAISHGFIKNKTKKISLLKKLINSYKKSVYRDDALYVLAGTYTASNKNTLALQTYERLLKEHKRSSLLPRALLKKGLIYYNSNKNNQALAAYKLAVKKYPNTAIAKEAVHNARQIYVDTGRVNEYALWVKDLDFINVTDADLDNDMYEAADRQYTMNDYRKAIGSFKQYLKNFPKGLHSLQAHFYLAQSYESQNQSAKTASHYEYIVAMTQNEFTEEALSRLSQLYLTDKKWKQATPLLIRLEQIANHPQNIVFAQSNLMKAYYNNKDYTKSVIYADKVLNQGGVDVSVKSDATIIIARSALKTGNKTKAKTAYKEVENMASGVLKAEALFYDALFKHEEGDYNNSNKIVQKIASDYAAYKYWGAKGLVVMAKNFYALNDAYQATYILDSVIKNFKQFDDVIREAKKELAKIKSKEAKTNDSVISD